MDDITLYLALIFIWGASFIIFGVVTEVVDWGLNRKRSRSHLSRRLYGIKGEWK